MRKPYFIGTWGAWEKSPEQLIPGTFRLYLTEMVKIEDKKIIKGTIEDCFGEATFEGEMCSSHIKFTKRYSKEAIEKGGHWDKIEYRGAEVNGLYAGKFIIVNGILDNIGTVGNWEGTFYMSQYFGPSLN
ncbi:MAG: hypothetical protein IB618_00760 [Candidatus Pacearchaeota archaeon]|nr:MAG: hypothetical protein IB618_00760 [Candidatus Pacearchaeota archaeon]